MPSTLAILAHPMEVSPLMDWLTKNQRVLTHFQIKTTPDIAERIEQGWGLQGIDLVTLRSPELGGDIELAAQILAGDIAGVLFFVDAQAMGTAHPDFAVVLRACQLQNIPIALNELSASLLLRGLAQSQIAYLIFNPVAGQGNPNLDLALIRETLEPQILVDVIMTQPGVDPADQAREVIAHIQSKDEHDMGGSLIIAAGGDGTVSAVAGATIGTDIPLGIIPRGTANAFAVGLKIPTNLRAACATILAGNTHVVDAARCNDIPMILLAGLGFEAGMVSNASRELKYQLGNLAYLLSGVRQLATAQPFEATLEIEGELTHIATTAITVANVAPSTSVLAQGFGGVIPDDGLLEITIATPKTRLQGLNAFASLVASAAVGNPTQRDDIVCLRTRRMKVTTNPPQKLVIDGEILEANPIEFECIPKGLTVFAPLSTL
ncbi:MAG: YegS/Rv2252/BmrU family lipid kinase [Leptolyngbyaceae cyanobacterium SM2_3_12]|nr:YegS/Rv2252/BmrU family lipid kinase [Leptolyngbyaceae cyanobacterium SM2_3_12]